MGALRTYIADAQQQPPQRLVFNTEVPLLHVRKRVIRNWVGHSASQYAGAQSGRISTWRENQPVGEWITERTCSPAAREGGVRGGWRDPAIERSRHLCHAARR